MKRNVDFNGLGGQPSHVVAPSDVDKDVHFNGKVRVNEGDAW